MNSIQMLKHNSLRKSNSSSSMSQFRHGNFIKESLLTRSKSESDIDCLGQRALLRRDLSLSHANFTSCLKYNAVQQNFSESPRNDEIKIPIIG